WRHPKVHVYEVAAAPDGQSLAYVLERSPSNPGPDDVMAYLYLLEPDGRIELVDQATNFGSLESPVFLRSHSEIATSGQAQGPVRLYWYRGSQNLKPGTAHLDTRVMVLDGDRLRQVQLGLRPNEAPIEISGYAGSPNLTIISFRHDNLPTRGEVLRLEGAPSLTDWREFGSAANTDQLDGIAWVSPTDYVVPVSFQNARRDYSLRLFRVGCEFYGSHLVYQ